MLKKNYSDTDVKYMRTFKLKGGACTADSKRIFDELQPLIIDGPGGTYVKLFELKRDGRGAILALKRQAEGIIASKQRKSIVYSLILYARFLKPLRRCVCLFACRALRAQIACFGDKESL